MTAPRTVHVPSDETANDGPKLTRRQQLEQRAADQSRQDAAVEAGARQARDLDQQRRDRLAALPDDERAALRVEALATFSPGVRPPAQLVRLRACELLDNKGRP